MGNRHLLRAADLSLDDTRFLVDMGLRYARGAAPQQRTFIAGMMFFEESTRTRVGFEAATARLGGSAVTINAVKQTVSMSDGESWADTIQSIGPYFDVLCIRHPSADAPSEAVDLLDQVSVVNCGSGLDEHPTQMLIDLAAVFDHAGGEPDSLDVAIVGDLRHMRAVHSFVIGLAGLKSVSIRAVSPPGLGLPPHLIDKVTSRGHTFTIADSLPETLDADIVYMAGFAPRNEIGEWDNNARRPYTLTRALADRLNPKSAILSPLPRIDEIETSVDQMPQAKYFRQSYLGLGMRVAVLEWALSTY